ncbi:MAG: hypothetical protein KDB69_00990, partial [Acidimicrobiia bacterium]|nr:hypothetical protein [Acidimicrobiia bacterium]
MKRTVRFLVGGLLIASIVTACGGDTVDDPFGGYEIEQYRNASGELTDPAPDSYPYLAVDAAGIAGNTGCNSFFAGATIGSDGSWSLDDAIGM